MTVDVPADLKMHYRAGRVVPFVGAGVSMSVEWQGDDGPVRGPSWKSLVDHAVQQLGIEVPDLLRVRGTDLQILEYFKEHRGGSMTELTNWLLRHMSAPDDALRHSPVHAALAALSEVDMFYTTNFDDFLERALVLHNRPADTIAVEFDISRAAESSNEVEVVKFHGDWSHPGQMVLSESDYEERLKLAGLLDHRLRADLLGRVSLFLGYSFRDPNVAYLFRLLNDEFGDHPEGTGRRGYIVVRDPSDFERRLFRQRNIDVIGIDGRRQTEEVAAVLRMLEA